MSEFVLGKSEEFAEHAGRLFEREGKMILVVRADGKLHAMEERCSHRAGPLSEGKIQDGRVRCPWHGAEFDLNTGAAFCGPARRNLTLHQVAERDGMVVLTLNASAPT